MTMLTASLPTTFDAANPLAVMSRYELKYILNSQQCAQIREGLKGHMVADQFGKTAIASLYYDTPDFLLIRESLEKPQFKEKIRLRSYGLADENSPVYLELKRKATGIVYKRRVRSTIGQVNSFFDGYRLTDDSQISRELAAFRDYYQDLRPACLIICDRTAYYQPDGDLRLTIDENPRCRFEQLNLNTSMDGQPLLEEGGAIMEVKIQQAIPLWLCSLLDEAGVCQGSFSKYGEAYRRRISSIC